MRIFRESKAYRNLTLACLSGLAIITLPIDNLQTAHASALTIASESNAPPERSGAENILRAVRSWSQSGFFVQDDALITHSVDGPAFQPGVTHFPINGSDGLLNGEDSQTSWPIYLTAADLAGPVAVKIGFTNSVTVLPESSRLGLWVNGTHIATTALRHTDKIGYLEADIAPARLNIGRNELTLKAQQHHRIDCSLEGSYDLWTAIDLQSSILRRAHGAGRITQLQDLAAISRSADQSVAVNLVLPSDSRTDNAHKEALLTLVQQVILAAQIKKPSIQVMTEAALQNVARTKGSAIDVFAGSLDALQRHAGLQALYQIGDGQDLLVKQQKNVALVPSADGTRILIARIDELAQKPDGFSFLGQYVDHNKVPQEESSISLAELGYSEREYSGHRFSEQVRLTLPADFYPADYDSVEFHLFASYAKSIKRGEVQLLINGKSKISLPIRMQDDGLIQDRLIKLPLSAFSAGVNRVEIIGLFEKNDAETQCATRINRTREAMFYLSGESYFSVPKLAHLPVLPNVRTTLTTGYPYRNQDGSAQILVQLYDETMRGLKVTADFLSRLAINSDQVFTTSMARAGETSAAYANNRIIIGNFASVPAKEAHFQQGVDLIALAQASQGLGDMAQGVDLMPTASINAKSVYPAGMQRYDTRFRPQSMPPMPPLPQQSGNALSRDSLKEVFRQRAARERDGFQFSAFSSSVKTIFSPVSRAVAKVTHPSDGPASLSGNNKALISQRRVDGEVTTLVSYNMQAADYLDFDSLFASTARGSDPIHTVSISGYGETLTQLKSEQEWIGNLPLSHSKNWHLLFAGWLSNNPPFYAFLTFVSLLVFGLLSSVILNRTKRSNGDDFEQTY
ncbi:cellulose biosynthesis cyclic di-GMP-binding regulatory protein BcsB [Cohaesibacter celericrescens]|uniref:Cyclic di-GMP-binding protein n=1 Tax=Cohaesibacter celericrescens TaxID=2067669 RepID=A0A2N5XV86_9HYPH|nr:cellulose biosynthesis cyclic di-GMP-binding regulatory protein BcsB [Cohaesibacter celericrescens]PLW78390.1 hypothetical protein C0081_04660 [Cohaesibacter celericrescens]